MSDFRFSSTLRLVISLALALATCSLVATSHADEDAASTTKSTTTTTTKATKAHHRRHHVARRARRVTAARQVNTLRGQVANLRRQQAETTREVRKIQRDIQVVLPASPTAAPRTVGEHVALVERDLSETRRSLAENLGIHVHGLLDATYEYNIGQPNGSNPPGIPGFTDLTKGGPTQGTAVPGVLAGRINQFRAFDTDANGFELTQFNLHIDRTVEEGVGFVLDLNVGKTAEQLRALTRYTNGPFNASGGAINDDIIDPTQAYLTYTVPVAHGINLSAGKYVTLLGAEVVDTYNNLNYNESRGLLFTFGIPFTHTGVRANYAFTDRVGLTLGINNGWDNVADNNDGKTLEGQLALAPTDWMSLATQGLYGPEQNNRGNSKRGITDTVVTLKTPVRGLSLVGEYLYGHEDGPVSTPGLLYTDRFGAPFGPATTFNALQNIDPKCKAGTTQSGPDTGVFLPFPGLSRTLCHGVDWQGAAMYFVYDLSSRLTLVGRGEYFRDSDGVRTGVRQHLYEGTFTANYKLANGLLARAEYRHDESQHNVFMSHNDAATSVLVGGPNVFLTHSGQDTVEGALIYSF